MTGLVARIRLVDDIDATLPPDDAAVLVALLQRLQRIGDLHGGTGARNAALLAIAILANSRPDLRERLRRFRTEQSEKVLRETLP